MDQSTILTRFDELITKGGAVLSTKYKVYRNEISSYTLVDRSMFEQWAVSSLSLIGRAIGKDSEHYERFAKSMNGDIALHSNADSGIGALKAAREDVAGNWLFSAQQIIRAEVFSDFLDQAQYFLKESHHAVACVIAGAVFEESLRKLCAIKGIILPDKPKLDWMNAELGKAKIYDKLVQKKVVWLADIRNKAAHGKWNEFTHKDAEEMLRGVERFAEEFGR